MYNLNTEKFDRLKKLKASVFWAKILRWEFWPFSVFYFPVSFYWLWLAIKSRSLFFFTASNPTIEFGGMLGESKDEIYKLIPENYLPKTIKYKPSIDQQVFLEQLRSEHFEFPIIVKPDIGQRGWMVEMIKSEKELACYLNRVKVDFLVQEYISYEVELGVFYYRYPDEKQGTISSIVVKDMLSVIGDGRKTVQELMAYDARTKMHIKTIQKRNPELLSQVPESGEQKILNPIGNHSLGTSFINGNHLINDKLIGVFDLISSQIDGFYFGRYDLRCTSMEDLYEGKNFKILELNGAGAEPAHIYHPGSSLISAYKDVIHHLRVLADISLSNKRKGIPYMSFYDGLQEMKKIIAYNRKNVA